jgi:hypothetical protein
MHILCKSLLYPSLACETSQSLASAQLFHYFFFRDATAASWPGPVYRWCFKTTFRHTTFSRTPLDEWSALRRNIYPTIHHSQEIDLYTPGGTRTRNPSKPAAEDLRLRSHGHWYQHSFHIDELIKKWTEFNSERYTHRYFNQLLAFLIFYIFNYLHYYIFICIGLLVCWYMQDCVLVQISL